MTVWGKQELKAEGLYFRVVFEKLITLGLFSVKCFPTHSHPFFNLSFPYVAKAGALLAIAGVCVSKGPTGDNLSCKITS